MKIVKKMKKFQLEDDRTIIESGHYTLQEAIDHALRLKKHSHRNRPLKIYETTDGIYELKERY